MFHRYVKLEECSGHGNGTEGEYEEWERGVRKEVYEIVMGYDVVEWMMRLREIREMRCGTVVGGKK